MLDEAYTAYNIGPAIAKKLRQWVQDGQQEGKAPGRGDSGKGKKAAEPEKKVEERLEKMTLSSDVVLSQDCFKWIVVAADTGKCRITVYSHKEDKDEVRKAVIAKLYQVTSRTCAFCLFFFSVFDGKDKKAHHIYIFRILSCACRYDTLMRC